MDSTTRPYKYYEILGLNRNAVQTDIKRAYRRLAKIFYPDVHMDVTEKEKANDLFKKINEAHEVLSNLELRKDYDNSSAECPRCWTHEVLSITSVEYRCRRCGFRFDSTTLTPKMPEVRQATIHWGIWKLIRIFKTTQCSWCRDFYTRPFLCPHNELQSNCANFVRMDNEQRNVLISDETWWLRIFEMMGRVLEKGILAKCRKCGAMNPNPRKKLCWQCGQDTLSCPACNNLLNYDEENDYWHCVNDRCNRTYKYLPKKRVSKSIPSEEICPNCNSTLYFDNELLLWRCLNPDCRHVYTHQDLHKTGRTYRERTKGYPETKSQTRPKRPNLYGTASLVFGIIGFFVAIIPLGIIAIVLAIIQWRRYGFTKSAIAGLVLGIIHIIVGVSLQTLL